jgi:hypothetical protein
VPNADLSTNILDERGSPFLCCPCVPTCGIVGLRNLGHAIGLIGRMSINIAPHNLRVECRRCCPTLLAPHGEDKMATASLMQEALCRKPTSRMFADLQPSACSC